MQTYYINKKVRGVCVARERAEILSPKYIIFL